MKSFLEDIKKVFKLYYKFIMMFYDITFGLYFKIVSNRKRKKEHKIKMDKILYIDNSIGDTIKIVNGRRKWKSRCGFISNGYYNQFEEEIVFLCFTKPYKSYYSHSGDVCFKYQYGGHGEIDICRSKALLIEKFVKEYI